MSEIQLERRQSALRLSGIPRVLIEHIANEPFTGKVTGGTERSAYLARDALRRAGCHADLIVTADSVDGDHIRAKTPSGRSTGQTDLRGWYRSLAEAANGYDAIMLNHPITSPTLFAQPSTFLRRCTYINRNASSWYVTGAAGMRLIGHLKLLRHVGGRALYLSTRNRDQLARSWSRQTIESYHANRFAEAGVRVAADPSYLNLDPFDGHFDESICPPDIAAPAASEGYVVSIGRADSDKRLALAGKVAHKLRKPHIVFTTSIGPDLEKDMRTLQKLGAEVFVDADHEQIMATLAGADALILSSHRETYCHIAMEAVAHGVPVMAMEVPPALADFGPLVLPWGRVYQTTSLETRQRIQEFVRTEYSLDALGQRLRTALNLGTSTS